MNDMQAPKTHIDDLVCPPPVTELARNARGIPPTELPEIGSLSATKAREGGSLFDIFPLLRSLKNVFDYLGGSREEAPAGLPLFASPWWFGLWWGLLAGLILLFCGQTSKFIYIDF